MLQDSDLDPFLRPDAGSDEPAAASVGSSPTQAPSSRKYNFDAITPEIADAFKAAAQAYGIDENVLIGIAAQESGFNPKAIGPVTSSGQRAVGLMQFMPDTAKRYGIDPNDPIESIVGAAAYMRNSLDKFGGDYRKAIASYNWGENRKAFDAPDWEAKLPPETKEYLAYVGQFVGMDQPKDAPAQGAPFGTAKTEDRGFVPDAQDMAEMDAASKPYFGTSSPKSRGPQQPVAAQEAQREPDVFDNIASSLGVPRDVVVKAVDGAKQTAIDAAQRRGWDEKKATDFYGQIVGDLVSDAATRHKLDNKGLVNTLSQLKPSDIPNTLKKGLVSMFEGGNALLGNQYDVQLARAEGERIAKKYSDALKNEFSFTGGVVKTTLESLPAMGAGVALGAPFAAGGQALLQGTNAGRSALLATGLRSPVAASMLEAAPAKIGAALGEAAASGLGGAAQAGQEFDAALKSGQVQKTETFKRLQQAVGEDEAIRVMRNEAIDMGAMYQGAATGVTSLFLPSLEARMVNKAIGSQSTDVITRALAGKPAAVLGVKAIKEPLQEFVQSGAESIAGDIAAKRTFAPDKEVGEEALKEASMGAMAGLVTSGAIEGRGWVRDYVKDRQALAEELKAQAKITDIGKAKTMDEVAAAALEVVNSPVAQDPVATPAGPLAPTANPGAAIAADLAPTVDAITALETQNAGTAGNAGVVDSGTAAGPGDQAVGGVGAAGLGDAVGGASGGNPEVAVAGVGRAESVPQPNGERPAGVEPAKVWYGRRGDGYLTPADAQRGLGERQRLQGQFDWRIEPTPDGKYRLAGYAPSAATGTVQASAPAYQSVNQAPITFRQGQGGSWFIGGDPATVRDLLKSNGVTNFIPTRGGAQLPASTDPEVIGAIQAMAEDFKNLSQQELKDEIRQRLGMTAPPKTPKQTRPFRDFLRSVGIRSDVSGDVVGESNAVRANQILPMTFRRNGLNLDVLAERAFEMGFLTQADIDNPNDNGGVNRLLEMIRAESRGMRQAPIDEQISPESEQSQAEKELTAALDRLGVPASSYADLSVEQMNAMVNRIERKLMDARLRRQALDVAEESRLEREAIQWADTYTQVEQERVQLADQGRQAPLESFLRALRLSEQEIQDELAREAEKDRVGQASGEDVSQGPQGSVQAGDGNQDRASPAGQGGKVDLFGTAPNASQQEANRIRLEREDRERQAANAAPAPDDFMLTGSNTPADRARAAGQMELGDSVDTSAGRVQKTAESEQVADAQTKGGFDSEAWDKERSDRIKQSRESGNVHLDTLPKFVESMRGKAITYVHDTKERGRILSVDNRGKVYVEWLDKYSQDKEMASPMNWGKRKGVMTSSLGPSDLKDYYVVADRQPAPSDPQAQEGSTGEPQAPASATPSAQQAAPSEPAQEGEDAPIDQNSNLPDGTTIKDGNGNLYRVHYQRNGLVIAHPIIDGKPVVSKDTSVRFWVDNRGGTPSGESDRTDPIFRAQKTGEAEPIETNDRDSFTLERLNQETNKMETITFRRGEYVTFKIGEGGKQAFGEIDGISHARRQFSVDGLWHDFGFAYKAERPAPAQQDKVPMSTVVDAVNKKHGGGLGPADAVSIVEAFKGTMRAVYSGTASIEDYKTAYSKVRDAEKTKAELGKLTKDELIRTFGIMARTDEKKDSLVATAYKSMLRGFALGKKYGSNTYMMTRGGLENYERQQAEALDAIVQGHTADDLAAFAAEVKAKRDEESARRAAAVESIKNPKTLDEYRRFMSYHTRDGKSTTDVRLSMLTPEQRAEFDLMLAEESRGRRKANTDDERTQVRVAGQTVDGNIIATKHTKKGHDLFVVQLSERVSREDYETLNTGAKKIGGYYSSFRVGGAIPGFQFTTREQAQAFVTLAGGDATAAKEAAQERRDAYADDRSQTAAERLTEMANAMEEAADESLNRERKTNTARRARFANAAEAGARQAKAMAKTMRNVAGALEAGTVKLLDRIRTKTQVELLQTYIANAKDAELRAKYPTYAEQEKHKGQPPTQETADYAVFPEYTAFRSDLASLGRQLQEVDGTKKLGDRLMKVADDVSDAFTAWAKEPGNLFRLSTFSVRSGEDVKTAIFRDRETAERAIKRSGLSGKAIVFPEKRGVNRIIMSPSEAIAKGIWTGDGDKRITLSDAFGAEIVEGIGRAAKRGRRVNDRLNAPWQFERAYERRKQLTRMGIETPAEFRAALREFIGLREQAEEADKIKAMERAMIGRTKDGLDFFPTPESVADEMIAAANLQPGMRVLEPSAGMGHIAERIREAGFDPEVGEVSNERRELLEAKGFNVKGRDFMDMAVEANAPTVTRDELASIESFREAVRGDVLSSVQTALYFFDRGDYAGAALLMDRATRQAEFNEPARAKFGDIVQRLEAAANGGYDRIIMNPPFSDGRDIEHVRHAYTLLKPGGRLVALMGESAFTNQNKRATEFREWLDSLGGTEEKLPDGSFMDPSLPVNTGANARMVVIEKESSAPAFSRNPFYSSLRQSIEKINAKALTPGMWQASIQGLINKGSIKSDEVEWSGLNEWLGLQEGKVTKDQVLGFLDANGVRVEEVVLGAQAISQYDRMTRDELRESYKEVVGYDPVEDEPSTTDEEMRATLREYAGQDGLEVDGVQAPKYGQYQLPGGTNYREVLLTLPVDGPQPVKQYRTAYQLFENGELISQGDERAADRWRERNPAADIRTTQVETQASRLAKPEGVYNSSHWDQPNVLAHIRLNDRVDAEGAKTLFVEELQSDWGQEGKKKGFAGPELEKLNAAKREYEALVVKKINNPRSLSAEENARIKELQPIVAGKGPAVNGVPRAPFVDKTDKWLTLALKRVMVMAAQEGYDRVAFINGEQSAERYDLSKHVEAVAWAEDGTLQVKRLGGSWEGIASVTDGNKLADYVGKDAAQKLVDATPDEDGQRILRGLDLKIGGEGMRAFYDSIVPNTLKPLLKKVGGGSLETVSIDQGAILSARIGAPDDAWPFVVYVGDREVNRVGRRDIAEEEVADLRARGKDARYEQRLSTETQQPGFTITPEMRERLVGGMPLFRSDGTIAGGLSVEATRKIIDAKVSKWTNGPRVVVVASPRDLPFAAPDDANGAYHQGSVYIVAGAHRRPGQVLRTLAHEAVAHYGLRGMLGDGYKTFLKQMQTAIKLGNKPLTAIRDDVRARYDGLTELQEADEIAARAIEMGLDADGNFKTGFGFLKSVFAKVAQFLRSLGILIPVTNLELQGMLVNAQRFVQGRASEAMQGDVVPAMSRTGTLNVDGVERPRLNSEGQPIHPTEEGIRNFWRWFGDSKVVDDEGRPLVVYHGTKGDFNVFGGNRAVDVSGVRSGMPYGGDVASSSGPFWFTTEPNVAFDDGSNGSNVMPVYVKITTPIRRTGYFGMEDFSMPEKYKFFDKTAQMWITPDGVIGDNGVVVAFRPNQIKSATGNTGAFSADNDDIAFSRGQPGLFDSGQWDVPETGRVKAMMDALIQKLQDGRIDLKRAQDAIVESGRAIDEKFDARLAETLYAGRVAHRTENFINGEAKELLERMARLNVNMTELSDFLLARHAPERNAQIAKVNPDMPDGGAGSNSKGELMTTQAARDYIAKLPSETKLKMTTLAALVDKITKGTRQLLVSEGLESQQAIDAWEGAYSNYVPLFKDEAQGVSHPIGQGMSVRGSSSRRATGSTGEVTNMLAHVMMQREAAITRAEKNRVGLALYGLALSHPNKAFWTTIRPNMSEEAIADELDAMGVDLNEAQQGMSYAPTIRKVDDRTGQVVNRPNPLYKSLPGAMVVRVNGEDRVLMLNQNNERAIRLAQNLKNLDGLDIANETMQKIVGKPTRWIASVNTQYNPAFGLVNMTRDALGAMVNLSSTQIAGKQLRVAGYVPSAMAGIFQHMRGDQDGEWAKLYEQFQMDGGKTGFKDMFRTADERTEALQKMLDKVDRSKLDPREIASGLLSVLDGFNTISENIVRLSAYKVALDSGLSRAESARLARELTVDFNRKGSHGTTMGMLYAFFNASVQGTARTVKAIQGPAGKSIILGGLALGTMQALMLAAAGYDDDEIPEWVKARGFIIPLGKDEQGQKKHAIIPLPLGLHVLPNTGRVMAELALYGKRDMGEKVINAIGEIAGAFNPFGGGNVLTDDGRLRTIAPTVLDPLVDLATNTNFSGRKIEKDYRETDNRPGFQRAREGTIRTASGQAYISVSKAMNWMTGGTDYQKGLASPSPEQIRYVAQVVGGGLLREAEKIVNLSMPVESQRDVKVTGIPLAGRFYGVADDEQTQSSRYYKNAKEIDKIESSMGAAKKAGDRQAMDDIAKDPRAGLIHYNNTVGSRLAKLNKLAVQTVNDRARTLEIDKDRTELMRALNDEVIRLEEKADGPTLAKRMRQ